MKGDKKCYVLMLQETFPVDHPHAGRPTDFERMICEGIKIHTIRNGHTKWELRAKEVNRGHAYISMRVWVGKPYGKGSTVREIKRLDAVLVQKIQVNAHRSSVDVMIDGKPFYSAEQLASNDGLSVSSLFRWLLPDVSKPFFGAIIHFTTFRYNHV